MFNAQLTLISLLMFTSLLSISQPIFASTDAKMPKADLVIVDKSNAKLSLLRKGKTLKSYRIALGESPKGHKLTEGDQRTPQGRYILDYKKSNSTYYKAIHISYPNAEDILRAQALGIDPGGQIMIHGQNPNSSLPPEEAQKFNWTDGCIAITNKEMDEIWLMIDEGTPIEIWP